MWHYGCGIPGNRPVLSGSNYNYNGGVLTNNATISLVPSFDTVTQKATLTVSGPNKSRAVLFYLRVSSGPLE